MRNIDLYKTPTEADKAFHEFCDKTKCECCPYDDPKEPDCKLNWVMAEVETTCRANFYTTVEAAVNDFNEVCHNVTTGCATCKYNIAKGGRDVCMAAWLMEKLPK